MKPVFEMEADVARNVLRLRFSGDVTAVAMDGSVRQVEELLKQLRVGFAVMTDLTAMDTMALECAPYIAAMMDLYRAQGLATVVRIIPDHHKDIGLNILSATHYRGSVRLITCETLEEAERALA